MERKKKVKAKQTRRRENQNVLVKSFFDRLRFNTGWRLWQSAITMCWAKLDGCNQCCSRPIPSGTRAQEQMLCGENLSGSLSVFQCLEREAGLSFSFLNRNVWLKEIMWLLYYCWILWLRRAFSKLLYFCCVIMKIQIFLCASLHNTCSI